MVDFHQIDYLAHGSTRQRAAYVCVSEHLLLAKLAPFRPALVSTVCLGVDTDSSDLDIVCFAPDLAVFERRLKELFGAFPRFSLSYRAEPYAATLASFYAAPFEIEVFGAPVDETKQNAYRHLHTLARLIDLGGEAFREQIRSLKASGLKTEPAIATRLCLPGDPYAAVLALEGLSDDELTALIGGAHEPADQRR